MKVKSHASTLFTLIFQAVLGIIFWKLNSKYIGRYLQKAFCLNQLCQKNYYNLLWQALSQDYVNVHIYAYKLGKDFGFTQKKNHCINPNLKSHLFKSFQTCLISETLKRKRCGISAMMNICSESQKTKKSNLKISKCYYSIIHNLVHHSVQNIA